MDRFNSEQEAIISFSHASYNFIDTYRAERAKQALGSNTGAGIGSDMGRTQIWCMILFNFYFMGIHGILYRMTSFKACAARPLCSELEIALSGDLI